MPVGLEGHALGVLKTCPCGAKVMPSGVEVHALGWERGSGVQPRGTSCGPCLAALRHRSDNALMLHRQNDGSGGTTVVWPVQHKGALSDRWRLLAVRHGPRWVCTHTTLFTESRGGLPALRRECTGRRSAHGLSYFLRSGGRGPPNSPGDQIDRKRPRMAATGGGGGGRAGRPGRRRSGLETQQAAMEGRPPGAATPHHPAFFLSSMGEEIAR